MVQPARVHQAQHVRLAVGLGFGGCSRAAEAHHRQRCSLHASTGPRVHSWAVHARVGRMGLRLRASHTECM